MRVRPVLDTESPPNPSSLADLDQELEELGVNLSDDVDDLVSIAPHQAETELTDGPIDGLSLN